MLAAVTDAGPNLSCFMHPIWGGRGLLRFGGHQFLSLILSFWGERTGWNESIAPQPFAWQVQVPQSHLEVWETSGPKSSWASILGGSILDICILDGCMLYYCILYYSILDYCHSRRGPLSPVSETCAGQVSLWSIWRTCPSAPLREKHLEACHGSSQECISWESTTLEPVK